MEECLKGKVLNKNTCRFVKHCKPGFYRNKSYKCRKMKKDFINIKNNMDKQLIPNESENINPTIKGDLVKGELVTGNIVKNDSINSLKDIIASEKIPEEVKIYITDSKKAKSLPIPIRNYLSSKNNSLPLKFITPQNKISFSQDKIKKALIELDTTPPIKSIYKTVYPENYDFLEENDKKYLVFKNGGTGIMLADSLYKDNKIINLTKAQLVNHINPTIGWYASEKYDGLRGLWTGKELISRPQKTNGLLKGKFFNYCPEWFINLLPPGISLDGEIWLGRGRFQEVNGLSNLKIDGKMKKEEIDKIWKKVKYMVFDIPSEKNKPFNERMIILKKIIDDITIKYGQNCPIIYPTLTLIDSEEKLTEVYNNYTSNGAEGIIIREPNSLYENKRSKFMLKMKIGDDGEAIVVGYILGKGRLDGMLGSIKCKLKNGTTFNIGSGFNDIVRSEYNDPKSVHYIPLNSIVNFAYMEKTKEGVPRHPIYRGIRTDIAINDIL